LYFFAMGWLYETICSRKVLQESRQGFTRQG